MSEFLAALRWLLALELVGLAGLPLARWLFGRLPGRGYAFARPLGILLASYVLWILGILGFLRLTAPSFLLCLGAVFGLGWALGGRLDLGSHERRQMALLEAAFVTAYAAAAAVRAFNPEIAGTEKPMEFAFLNAILRSRELPPPDPWLSGYAISYYYFGYFMVGALAQLASVPAAMAFNLGLATLFALTVTGAFAVVQGMVALRSGQSPDRPAPVAFGMLGAVAVAIMGNLEGFLEVLHSRGLGSAAFWRWLDIKDLLEPPTPGPWMPQRYLWWWRASRVINDRNPLGEPVEVIDEFPFFSFLLGDMHPHVLALPFVLVAVALCLEWLLRRGLAPCGRPVGRQHRPFLAVAAVVMGGLGFLNTWDWPIYLALFMAATWLSLPQLSTGERLRQAIAVGLMMAGAGLLLYLPFYLSFGSQASGFLPNFTASTKLRQFGLMFGPFLFVTAVFSWYRLRRLEPRPVGRAALWWVFLFLVPFFFLGLVALALVALPQGQAVLEQLRGLPEARRLLESRSWGPVLWDLWLAKWRSSRMLWLVSGVMAAGLAVMERRVRSLPADFALAMMVLGLALTWAVEFVYLRDYFGTRMNTVFKFYYQAWVLLGLASSYAAYHLWRHWQGVRRWAFAVPAVLLLLLGLIYPPLSLWTKTDGLAGKATLDGTAYLARSMPAVHESIQWLNREVTGVAVLAEATGGSYTAFGMVSANTGLPTILGWDFHERQWGRDQALISQRQQDVERLYTARLWVEAEAILRRYDVAYVYVGPLERQAYGPRAGELLAQRLPLVHRNGAGSDQVSIYGVY